MNNSAQPCHVSGHRGSPDTAYTSYLPREHVERIRQWHEEGLRAARAEAGTDGQTVDYLGLTLHVPPQVQPIHGMSHQLGETVLAEVRPGDRVLVTGTGCGVNGILAARAGADVLALDINPEAVRAARDNARRNGLADLLEVRLSDVFDTVDLTARSTSSCSTRPSAGFSHATCSISRRRTQATGQSIGSCARHGCTSQTADGC